MLKKIGLLALIGLSSVLYAYTAEEVKDYMVENPINQEWNGKKVVSLFKDELRKSGETDEVISKRLFGTLTTAGSFISDQFPVGATYKAKQLPLQVKIRAETAEDGLYMWKNEYFLIKYTTFFDINDPVFRDFIEFEASYVQRVFPLENFSAWMDNLEELSEAHAGVDNFLGYLQSHNLDTSKYLKVEVEKIKEKRTGTFEDSTGQYFSIDLDKALKVSGEGMEGKRIYQMASVIVSGEELTRLKKYMEKNQRLIKFNMIRKLNSMTFIGKARPVLMYHTTADGKIKYMDVEKMRVSRVLKKIDDDKSTDFYLLKGK